MVIVGEPTERRLQEGEHGGLVLIRVAPDRETGELPVAHAVTTGGPPRAGPGRRRRRARGSCPRPTRSTRSRRRAGARRALELRRPRPRPVSAASNDAVGVEYEHDRPCVPRRGVLSQPTRTSARQGNAETGRRRSMRRRASASSNTPRRGSRTPSRTLRRAGPAAGRPRRTCGSRPRRAGSRASGRSRARGMSGCASHAFMATRRARQRRARSSTCAPRVGTCAPARAGRRAGRPRTEAGRSTRDVARVGEGSQPGSVLDVVLGEYAAPCSTSPLPSHVRSTSRSPTRRQNGKSGSPARSTSSNGRSSSRLPPNQ